MLTACGAGRRQAITSAAGRAPRFGVSGLKPGGVAADTESMNPDWAHRALARTFQTQPAVLEDEAGRRLSVYLLEIDGANLVAETHPGEVREGMTLISRIEDPSGLPWIMPISVEAASSFSPERDRVVLTARPAAPDRDDRRVSRGLVDLGATLTPAGHPGDKRRARVVDLSPFGVGLLTAVPGVEAEQLFGFEARLGTTTVEATIEVRSVRAEPSGGWFLGCAFREVSAPTRAAIDRFLAGDDAPQKFSYRSLYQP